MKRIWRVVSWISREVPAFASRHKVWVGIVIVLAFLAVVIYVPRLALVGPRSGREAESDFRGHLLQALGGLVLAAGAYYTARTFALNREGQITERFTRAVEQLADEKKLDIRLGGIYALERIARDSETHYEPVLEVLTAFLRENARWKPESAASGSASSTTDVERELKNKSEPPELRVDFGAAATVLGRRDLRHERTDYSLDLRGVGLQGASLNEACLEKANLSGANLAGANLAGAKLSQAKLSRADLSGADLDGVNLSGADLDEANLSGANLSGANLFRAMLGQAKLSEADLFEADLSWAMLISADLSGAQLPGADLSNANLYGVDFTRANLYEADLSRANVATAKLIKAELSGAKLIEAGLARADLSGANLSAADLSRADLRGASLTQEQLGSAITNDATRLPRQQPFFPEAGG
jgi:uncharacterized protein YjbI with pentapeptide repeats